MPGHAYGGYQGYRAPNYQLMVPYTFRRPRMAQPHWYGYPGESPGTEGMRGTNGMSGMQGQQGMGGLSSMSGMQSLQGTGGMSGMSGPEERTISPFANLRGRYEMTTDGQIFLYPENPSPNP